MTNCHIKKRRKNNIQYDHEKKKEIFNVTWDAKIPEKGG
jgi:hypothetical protein